MDTKKFYKVKQVASMLGVSKSLIYNLIYSEKLQCKRIGRRILIPEDALRKLIAA
ncbi:MAG: helix-turn-helix domain-containing protein [Selenomonadaceae bacterium]|nr:helix-turn-helix domain-containing protein [Selenomonadaceae bacterium]